jgi:hypothetical protein
MNDKFWRMWKKRSWSNLRYIAVLICLQGLRKTWTSSILKINIVTIHLKLIIFTQLQAYIIPYNGLAEVSRKMFLSRVGGGGVTYRTSFGLDDWIYCTLHIHTTRKYRQYNAIAILHTPQFTGAHALWFSVFTSRILATDFITVSLSLQHTWSHLFTA